MEQNGDPGQNGKVKDASWAVAYGLCIWGADSTDTHNIGVSKQSSNTFMKWISQFLP